MDDLLISSFRSFSESKVYAFKSVRIKGNLTTLLGQFELITDITILEIGALIDGEKN
mgnify:CR=1 FL=1